MKPYPSNNSLSPLYERRSLKQTKFRTRTAISRCFNSKKDIFGFQVFKRTYHDLLGQTKVLSGRVLRALFYSRATFLQISVGADAHLAPITTPLTHIFFFQTCQVNQQTIAFHQLLNQKVFCFYARCPLVNKTSY